MKTSRKFEYEIFSQINKEEIIKMLVFDKLKKKKN